jgi:MFS family permease
MTDNMRLASNTTCTLIMSSKEQEVETAKHDAQVVEVVEDAAIRPEAYPPLSTRLLVGVGLFLAVFLVGLDQTIVATALPKISDHFNSLNDVGWYASAFFLTLYSTSLEISNRRTALQPTFGKLYQVFNVKWVFLTALAIFELGSLICGVAPTSPTLIFGRAVAGSGAAVSS